MKTKVAAYCRVPSQHEMQQHSLAVQIDYYSRLFRDDENTEFVGIYADDGISGTQVAHREQFLQMIEDCRAGKINRIITKSVSRFGRNTVDTLSYTRELRLLGIDVYFEKENIHSLDTTGELMLTLIAAYAESESESLSQNVKWGLDRKYAEGKVSSLTLGKFFGYRQLPGGEPVVDETEAVTVRRIYREFLEGWNCTQIAEHLTRDGIPTERRLDRWNFSTVSNILKNEKYKGDALFHKSYVADPITHKRQRNTGEMVKYYGEDIFPAIVDRAVWDLVAAEYERQRRFCEETQSKRYFYSSEEFPLSFKVVCGTCGRTYQLLESKKVGDTGRKYWRCTSFHGKQWSVIPGRTFTPKPMARWAKDPNSKRVKYYWRKESKIPKEREMYCTDIEIPADKPIKAFRTAWNLVVSKSLLYSATLRRTMEKSEDALVRFHAADMLSLMAAVGKILEFDYPLMLRTLDRIIVNPNGKLSVCFFSGIKITL